MTHPHHHNWVPIAFITTLRGPVPVAWICPCMAIHQLPIAHRTNIR